MLNIKYDIFDFALAEKNKATHNIDVVSNRIIDSINNQDPYYKIFCTKLSQGMDAYCAPIAEKLKDNFSDVVIIAMGGAVLNPRALISLCEDKRSDINIHFLDNTDPIYLENLLAKLTLQDTAIVAISNSGNTLETNSLVGVMISEYEKADITDFGNNFYCITNLTSGILVNIAKKIGATILPHQGQISGRYSGLSSVVSFIARVAGIDMDEFFSGSSEVITNYIKDGSNSAPARAASIIHASNLQTMINIGYLQSFAVYLEWYSQIIAESTGKDGIGITPIWGLGPNDQHSMMQLYLDGPKNKLFNLLYVENIASRLTTSNISELGYAANKKLDLINLANFQATKNALIERKLPVRTMIIKDLSSKSIGSLIAHSMLEIITLCNLMEVNPFNQPGVELIKTKSKKLL